MLSSQLGTKLGTYNVDKIKNKKKIEARFGNIQL